MRLSLPSGLETTSLNGSAMPKKFVLQVASLWQNPSGVAVVGADPEPGWRMVGGIAYRFTAISVLMRFSAGDVLLRDAVLLSVQTTRCVDVWGPPEPVRGLFASSVAFE